MAQVVLADLCATEGFRLLFQWLSNQFVVGIFLAPPCGSASRARNIPLKRKRDSGIAPRAPQPLRSDMYLNGSFVDAIKVSKANHLYHLTARLVEWATKQGCLFCVENPQFSLFWQTSFIQSVIHLMQFTTFQSCCYVSTRPKHRMLGFNASEFSVINARCPGVSSSHRHEKWGVSPTSTQLQLLWRWRIRCPWLV